MITYTRLENSAKEMRGVDSMIPTGQVYHDHDCPHRERLVALGWRSGATYQPTRTPEMDDHLKTLDGNCTEHCERYVKIITWTGKVLCDREQNFYHDSDFYCVVWDDETAMLRTIQYATTRGGGGGSATIDATDEVKEKAQRWLERWARDELEVGYRQDSEKVKEGKRVVVSRGRKVPIGTAGIVEWMEQGNYGRDRVRIRTEDGETHWTDAQNCDVMEPETYVPSLPEIAELARRFAAKRVWHRPFVPIGMVSM